MKDGNSYRQILLGGGTVAGIIIFLAIISAVQFITVRNPKRWDMTRIGEHTLAPQSKQVLQSFKDKSLPVNVIGFYETKNTSAMEAARDLMDRYRDVDPNFTYSFLDPDLERAIAHKYKIDAYPTLIIKAGDREERIESATEENVTNALARLLKTEVKKVYFLKGHGEFSPGSTEQNGMSIAKESIEKQNYKTGEVVLLQAPDVPEDATALIIAGAKIDPLENEFESIKRFIDRGGSLMVMLNPFETPKLAEFLKQFGFETKSDIVVDRMSRALGGDYLMPVVTQYKESPITKGFELASFFPEARSVRTASKPVPSVVAQELALTSPMSWTIAEDQLKSGNANYDPDKGDKGPVSVMAVATYTNYASLNKPEEPKEGKTGEPSEPKEPGLEKDPTDPAGTADKQIKGPTKARIAVFGSAQLGSNKFYNLSGNRDLFMNTVSWLAADENLIAIRPKERRAQPLMLTASQSWMVVLIPVVLAPLAWIFIGVVVYINRRRSATA